MRLFIAEKPSMGREISKYLPEQKAVQRRNGFILQGDDVVTWAFGHVLEQAEPGDYDDRYKRWNAADLPIVPEEWKLLITKSSADQFHLIKELIAKADTIVNAGDPDREGQLLIDEILTYVGNKKPVQRILLNALDEKSVRAALADLRDNKNFFNLQQSALARSRADWLIGMNLSRAYTLAARRQSGNKVTFPIGRVKTPTLALVVRRERELTNFKPVEYYTLKVFYTHPKGSFWATWQPREEQAGLDPDGRLLKEEIAKELAEKLRLSPEGIVAKREKTKKKEPQRLPLSLSALQVLAGKAYGYDPQTVLNTAQKLYEKKLTTYPRSDCDYLPLNQYSDRNAILRNLSLHGDDRLSQWSKGSDPSIKSRAWNDKKITAHHAIIPTTVACKAASLPEQERNIYFLIAQAYIAQFYPVHEYEQTKLSVEHLGELFVAHGRVVTEWGWKELYRRRTETQQTASPEETAALGSAGTGQPGTPLKTDDNGNGTASDTGQSEEEDEENRNSKPNDGDLAGELPALKKGDKVLADNTAIDQKATKPPSRFTASTLLQAMKEIHKYVKNDDLKKQLKDVAGIGTEATRATIISELITRRFLVETGKKKVLQPTDLAYMLIDALPDEMTYPDETAVWEERLALMSEGKDKLEKFLADQIAFLTRLIGKAAGGAYPAQHLARQEHQGSAAGNRDASQSSRSGRTCPACKKGMLLERQGKFGIFYGCSNYPSCRYTENISFAGTNEGAGNGAGDRAGGDGAEAAIEVPEKDRKYKCPRCKTGYFLPVKNGNLSNWVCSNKGQCRTTCSDVNGKPSIYAQEKE